MTSLKPLTAAAVLVAGFLVAPAWAQQAGTAFNVMITIESACSIDTPAATDVDFGTVASTATNVAAVGTLSVNCTPGTAYDIALDSGVNGADITSRAMSDGTGTLVPYQLYREAGRTSAWGETVGTDTVAGIGDGDVQEVTVYGQVSSANFPAGAYNDTVTATVIW